ncbi:hypothetical protein DPMN_185666 [Dreissena polymorpha]|uniref:Uncharacterized protein n=1 Tax=Dreissena polymorpha TaxID=45954 RepID=A0A9D4I5S9_DREPO|nr:hypothetical protein DPMN_185666 [Dreissena polymorpha]
MRSHRIKSADIKGHLNVTNAKSSDPVNGYKGDLNVYIVKSSEPVSEYARASKHDQCEIIKSSKRI